MKKFLLSAIVLLFAFQLKAQSDVGKYSMEYFDGKEYPIGASEIKNNTFDFFISCQSLEGFDDIGFILNSSKVESFKETLQEIKNKYVEWSNTAKENNISDYDKDFDVKMPRLDVFFKYGSKYHIDGMKKPDVYFKVTTDGRCLVIFKITNIKANDNRYMTHDGLLIAFTSAQEIDAFIEALDPNEVIEAAEKKSNRDALFE